MREGLVVASCGLYAAMAGGTRLAICKLAGVYAMWSIVVDEIRSEGAGGTYKQSHLEERNVLVFGFKCGNSAQLVGTREARGLYVPESLTTTYDSS